MHPVRDDSNVLILLLFEDSFFVLLTYIQTLRSSLHLPVSKSSPHYMYGLSLALLPIGVMSIVVYVRGVSVFPYKHADTPSECSTPVACGRTAFPPLSVHWGKGRVKQCCAVVAQLS
jgi:hypothetical protein